MSTNETAAPVFCISVNFRRPGLRRNVSSGSDAFTTEADRAMLHVSKEIFKSKAYTDIKKLDSDVRRALKKRTAGNSYLRSGIYLVNASALEGLEDYLTVRAEVRLAATRNFAFEEYLKAKEEAKDRLGPLFVEEDYPTPDEIFAAFGLEWQVFSFPNVDGLKELSPSVWKKESEKFKSLWAQALEASRQLLRVEVSDLVDGFVDAMTPDGDGKTKRLHPSKIKNLQDFLGAFMTREVSNDTELRELVTKMQGALTGVDTKKLKSNEALRDAVSKEMADVKASLSKLVTVVKPARKYALDDEDEAEGDGAEDEREVA